MWRASGMLPAAAAVGDEHGNEGQRRDALAARQLSGGPGRARPARHGGRRHLLPPGAGARSRQRRADRAVVPDGAHRGQLAPRRGAGARAGRRRSRHTARPSAFMGLVEFKAQRYEAADEHFKAASANPIGELTSTLARAWLYQAQDKTQEALAVLDAPKQPPDWAQYYLRYHRALLADQAGRRAEARAAYERIPKNDQRTLRITLAYARHAANGGDAKLALSLLKAHFERTKSEGHPVARALQEQIEAGERPDLLVATPSRRAGGGVLRSRRGADRRRRRRPGCGLPAVRALSRARPLRSRWPRSPTPTRRPSATRRPSPPTTASPRARPCRPASTSARR